MTSSSTERSSNNTGGSLMRWDQHPVISTVLWIFGTNNQGTNGTSNETISNSVDSSNSSQVRFAQIGSDHHLTWKDQHGGNIHEYFSQVQIANDEDGGSSKNNRESAHQLPPSSMQSNKNVNSDLADVNPSPQWGFYVPITPPQEMFHQYQKEMMTYNNNSTGSNNAAVASSR